jgi:hypothetical protein
VSTTWNRETEDLFDFEAQDVTTDSFTLGPDVLSGPTQLTRSGNRVGISFASDEPKGEPLALCDPQLDGSVCVDGLGSSGPSRKRPWLVVRGLKGGYTLSVGEVVKLGFFKFRARQMVTSAQSTTQPDLRLSDAVATKTNTDKLHILTDEVQDGSQLSCRICLMEGSSPEDPLVRPCNCKGTIEYVHLGCLRHWIQDRLDTRGGEHGSFHWRPMTCELCKTSYPAYCRSVKGGKRTPLVEVPQTKPPFVVLENLTKDANQHSERGLHVLSLADGKQVRLGRGSNNDVSISDVSTSRLHATIKFEGEKIVIEDEKSKFGTFVAMRKLPALEPGGSMSLQVGRTILSLSMRGPDLRVGDAIDAEEDNKSVSTCVDVLEEEEQLEVISI